MFTILLEAQLCCNFFLISFCKNTSKSPSTDGPTTESKVKQESEEKKDIGSDIKHGQREQRQGQKEKRE